MVSTQNVADNLIRAENLIRQATQQGAILVLLPEFFAVIASNEERLACSEPFVQAPNTDNIINVCPIQKKLSSLAKLLNIWLIGGSVPLISHEPNKVWNSMLAYNPQGDCVFRYDKIHLFGFARGDEKYEERQYISAGEINQPLGFQTGAELFHAKIGASICYDLRFSEHYQRIQSSLGGMDILLLPAAFTYTTGRDHWETLLRARAIENQCYVLASAQGGYHDNGRRTFGHSMVIDPWGKVLSYLEEGEGVVMGEYRPDYLAEVREQLPALQHRRWDNGRF